MIKTVHRKYILGVLFFSCTFIFGINSIFQAKASTVVDNFFSDMEEKINSLESKQYYDIGYIKVTYSDTNPSEYYGGVWKLIGQGKTLLGMSSDYTVRETGGEKEVTLTTENLPSHTHTGTTATSGGHAHSFAAIPGQPNPSNASKTTFHFMTTEANQGLVSNASGPMLKEGYASIGSGGGHNHSFTTNASGGSQAHNNMQPYVTVYYWEKTANSSISSESFSGSNQEKLLSLTKRLYSIKEGSDYHKVGDIITLTTKYDPNNTEVFGGTWIRTAKGKTLVGVDENDADFSTVKTVGGEKNHTLTIDEIPSHTHTGTVSTRSAHTHAYNKSGSNLYGTAFHTTSGNKLYSNNPYDGNSSGLHNQELYAYAAPEGAHTHTFTTDATGAGQGHSNLMPYYTVYMWEKISDEKGAPQISDFSLPDMSIDIPVTINTTAIGSGLTYKYTSQYEGEKETVIQDYSSSSSVLFTPSKTGKVTITVYVKNSSGTIVNYSQTTNIAPKPSIMYKAHVSSIGWQDYVNDSQMAGTTGQSRNIQALTLKINNGTNYKLSGKVYINSIGYKTYESISSDQTAIGTQGRGLPLEKIMLSYEDSYGYKLQYRVHVSSIGWMDWVDNGVETGKQGYSIEAIEIRLVHQ